jgi:hypothetical protein
MRVDVATERPAPGGSAGFEVLGPERRPRGRPDRFELGVLVVFAVVSVWVLGLDVWQVVVHGRVWTGTDGVYIVDQMQYLSWIRSSSHHLLASNMFVLRSTPADYFQPAVVISGGLAALGMAPWLTLLLWKPVAVVLTFFAVREFAYRNLDGLWARRVAIVLALFFGSFTVIYGSFSVIGDLFPGFLSWGYTFGLMALALMTWSLLLYDRARGDGRITWIPGLLGAVASLLHPWHGELLIGTLVVAELLLLPSRRFTRRSGGLAVLTLVLTGLPLLYYMLLGRLDLSWKLAREASKHGFGMWTIMLAIAPLLIPALLAWRGRPASFRAAVNWAWPIAAVFVLVVSATGLSATPLHAFQGITIPLSVLAVQGVQRFSWRRVPYRAVLAAVVVFLFTVPATADELKIGRQLASPTVGNANFIERDERAALDYLEDSRVPGGVLTRSYLGAMVPEKTGRRTWIGDCVWSQPGCYTRSRVAQALFAGTLSPRDSRALVRTSGAAFVLADCSTTADMRKILRPMLLSVHRFGCATVYEVTGSGRPTGPLAESDGDAALRAPRRKQRHG